MAFIALANLSELHEGFKRAVRVQGRALLLIEHDGQRYIIEDRCPHMDAPLASGQIAAGGIRCRAHGINFDLRTGRAEGALASSLECLKRFPVAYEGTQIGLDLE